MGRFKVVIGSASAHCCFEATVVDTSKQNYLDGDGNIVYESICECFDVDSADKIAKALNSTTQ